MLLCSIVCSFESVHGARQLLRQQVGELMPPLSQGEDRLRLQGRVLLH
ncbi:MAG TPA: hypothetical protein VGN26_01245 [Armatimonadota bacterium]